MTKARLEAWDILCELLFADDSSAPKRVPACEGDDGLQTEVVGLANSCFVTASLWKAIRERGLTSHFSEAVRDYLAAFYELSRERSKAVLEQLSECIGALNRRDISPMPLKGAAHVLSGMYPDPAERFFSDIDLLVPPSRIEEASAALASIGFVAARSTFDYSQHHHLPVLVRSLNDAPVELHLQPVARAAQRGLTADQLWARATRENSSAGSWCLASATDTAMLTFLHCEVIDRYLARFILDLRSYLDLRHLIGQRGSEIDWDLNLDRAQACGAEVLFRRHLYVFDRLTGQDAAPSIWPNRGDPVHFLVSRRAIRWPVIQGLALDRIRQRYSCGTSPVIVNAYRIRALSGMIRDGIRRAWQRRRGPDLGGSHARAGERHASQRRSDRG